MPSLGRESSNEAIGLFLFSTIFLTEINKKENKKKNEKEDDIYDGLPIDDKEDMRQLSKRLNYLKNRPDSVLRTDN
jgi:hypothetical protein